MARKREETSARLLARGAPVRIGNAGREKNAGRKTHVERTRVGLKRLAVFWPENKYIQWCCRLCWSAFIPIVFPFSFHFSLSPPLGFTSIQDPSFHLPLPLHPHPHPTLNMSGGITLTVISYAGTGIAFLFSTLSLGNKTAHACPCLQE